MSLLIPGIIFSEPTLGSEGGGSPTLVRGVRRRFQPQSFLFILSPKGRGDSPLFEGRGCLYSHLWCIPRMLRWKRSS